MKDVYKRQELDGANMKVLDKEGNVVDEWTSVKDQPHVIKRLVVGEEYTLRAVSYTHLDVYKRQEKALSWEKRQT